MASYNKNPAAPNEPDGIVAVWNLHMLERPEFIFHSQVRSPTKFFSIAVLTLPCSRMSFPSLSLPSIQTLCLVVPTQGKFFCGIPDLNIFPFSRRRCQLPAIRILFMPCKWSAHRMHTILSPVAQTVPFAVGLLICLPNLRYVIPPFFIWFNADIDYV